MSKPTTNLIGVLEVHAGMLRTEFLDDPEAHHRSEDVHVYVMQTREGVAIPVVFQSQEQAEETPTGILISLTVHEFDPNMGGCPVIDHPKWFTQLTKGQPLDWLPRDKQIGIFRFVHPNIADETILAEAQAKVDDAARYAEDWWKRLTRPLWTVQARGFVIVSENRPGGADLYAKSTIERWIRENCVELDLWHRDLNPDGWRVRYHHAWGGGSSQYCGWGTVQGYWSMTYSSCSVKTIMHELGHNFGLYHSNAGNDTSKETEEYGDNTCVMGRGRLGINCIQRDRLKLDDDRERGEINDSTRIILTPMEVGMHGMFPDEYQYARIHRGEAPTFYISRRQFSEYLDIHRRDGNVPVFVGKVSVGKGTTLDQGNPSVRVEFLERAEHGDQALIEVKYGDRPVTSDLALPEEPFPSRPAGTLPDRVHTGLWYDSETPGQGIDVHVRDGMQVIGWYTFNQDEVDWGIDAPPRFYLATGPTDGEYLDLWTTSKDGDEPYEPEKIGHAQILFFDPSVAVLLYRTKEHGRGSIPLTRLAYGNQHPHTGIYFDPANPGAGLTLQFLPDGENFTGVYYTYGPVVRTTWGGVEPESTQRWYLVMGKKVAGKWTGKILKVSGSKFRWQGDRQQEQVGQIAIDVPEEGSVNATLTWEEGGQDELSYVRLL